MPNRILKESICYSETIDSLSPSAEIFFYRLIVNCDDYGQFDARPAMLRSRLFPLRSELKIPDSTILGNLSELVGKKLVRVYTKDSFPYLEVITWAKHQQIRAKRRKYPPFDSNCQQWDAGDISSMGNHLQSNADNSPRNPNPNPNPNPNIYTIPASNGNQLLADDSEKTGGNGKKQLDKSVTEPSLQKAIEVYENGMGRPATPTELQNLVQDLDDHGLEKIEQAVKRAVEHNARSYAYVRQCLEGGIEIPSDEAKRIFGFWNEQEIITHKALTERILHRLQSALKIFSESEVLSAIKNYAQIVNGQDYWFTHKWTLEDFLEKGVGRFVDSAKPLENYRKRDDHKVKKAVATNKYAEFVTE